MHVNCIQKRLGQAKKILHLTNSGARERRNSMISMSWEIIVRDHFVPVFSRLGF